MVTKFSKVFRRFGVASFYLDIRWTLVQLYYTQIGTKQSDFPTVNLNGYCSPRTYRSRDHYAMTGVFVYINILISEQLRHVMLKYGFTSEIKKIANATKDDLVQIMH